MDEIDYVRSRAPKPPGVSEEVRAQARARLAEHIRASRTRVSPRPRPSKRRVLSGAFAALALVALAVAIGLGYDWLTPRTEAGDKATTAEIGAISRVIVGWTTGFADSFCIPADAVSTVQARLKRLLDDPDHHTVDEGDSHTAVLPTAAAEQLDQRRAQLLARYASTRYKVAVAKQDWSRMIDEGLYNNPSAAPLIKHETEVLAVQVKTFAASECIAWALTWGGDVTTEGRTVQSWSVHEYRLVQGGGVWKIDGDASLGVMTAATGTAWGPYTVHDSVDQMELARNSDLYPGEMVPIEELQSLEAMVWR